MTGISLVAKINVLHVLLQGYIVEGISLRAGRFDRGIRNVRVSCDLFSSKSVSMFIAYYTCVGFDFVEMNG